MDGRTAIQQRAQAARLDYFTDYGLRYGLTPIQAARLAVEAERWMLQGVHMSAARLAQECALMQRKAA